jgi:multidrug efflux pump subunit AcrB
LTDASVNSKEQLENLVLQNSSKRVVRVKDIAKVEIGELQEYVKINANGKNVPLIAILKQPKSNLVETVKGVQTQIVEIQKNLPPGITLRPYYNQADFVSNAISSLRDVLWIGLLLALIVAFFFLRSIKAGSVILFTIPVTLAITIAVLYSIGYTMNIMTIGAIAAAIGLIIDDAIVVVEQIHRTHEEHPDTNSFALVHQAIKFLFPALVGSSLSTIVIFVPFFLMSGVSGAYFRVMTNTMIITLTSSFFVTWLGLPVVYIMFSKETHSIQAGKAVKRRNWVYYFVERPMIAVSFVVVLIAMSIYLIPKLPSGFLPEMDEGSIVLDYTSPPGSSLDETDKMLRNVDKILYETPEVESFSRRTGTQMGFFITEQNYGDYLIKLKNKRDKTTDEVSDVIRKKIESSLPALRVDFGQVIGDMLGDLMASVQPIEIKIFGQDHQKLQEIAGEVANVVEETKGTADVFNGITIAGPEITFEPDVAKLAQYQLSPQDFHSQLQTKIEGTVVSSILESNRTVDIRMIETGYKHDLNDIKHTSLFLPDGRHKPLTEFTEVKIRPGVAQVDRENLQSMVAVTARLNNRDLGATLKDIKKHIEAQIHLPAGYSIEYGGAYAAQQQAFDELLTILFVALLLVFIVILFLFKKIKVAFAIIFIAVLGIAGSILALFLTGTPLNVGSYTGIIMVVGIIGENSIFTYLQYEASRIGGEKRDDAIAYSISTRLRPKLMTALGAICALFPLALGIGVGAQMHQPLAIAIIGGLLIGLPLLLIVLPTMLHLVED